MNILVTTTTYPKSEDDTSPRFVHDLCKGFNKLTNINPIVLTPHSKGLKTKDMLDNIPIFRYKYFFEKFELISGNGIVSKIKKNPFLFLLIPFLMFFQLIAMINIIKNHKIDIILANWIIPQGLVAILVTKVIRKNIKIFIISHGGDAKLLNSNFILKIIGSFIIKKATKTIAVSIYIKKTLLQISNQKIEFAVIPMGVDINKFYYSNKKSKEIKYDIIFIGRLEEKKGIKILLDSIYKLYKKGLLTNTLIIGSGTLEIPLKKIVKNYKLENIVTFAGALSHKQIIQKMSLSKIFVLPSINLTYDSEGLPTVLLEAMSSGLPIITTDAGGITDIALDGYNSIIVKQNDAKMLSEKIEYLLTNPIELEKIKLNARKSAEEYSYENIVNKYIEILKG